MAEARTHVFRVSLNPKVYRDFEILSAKNLYDLASEIVRVFGFDFDHAFGFYSKLTGDVFGSPLKYELFADMGESDARSMKRTQIAEAFPAVGAKMTFLFDYGDTGSSGLKPSVRTARSQGANIQDFSKPSEKRPSSTPIRTMSDGALRGCHAALFGSIGSMLASSLNYGITVHLMLS